MGQKGSKKKAIASPSKKPVVDKARLEALKSLPEEISWHATKCAENPTDWEYEGNSEIGYFWKEFAKDTEDYKSVISLFKQLGGEKIPVKRVVGVYNPALVSRFANNRKLMEEKRASVPWSTSWKGGNSELRDRVYDSYQQKVDSYEWNSKLKVPILPTVHGTGVEIARSISQTGFAALASLDSGFFGKGIYFSSYAEYSLPYATYHGDPALILSYVVPGNIYPTVEAHKGPESLVGKPLRTPGYHSHYVVTQKTGFIPSDESEKPFYDEIVIPTEAQVMPAFLVELETSPVLEERKTKFQREIVLPTAQVQPRAMEVEEESQQ